MPKIDDNNYNQGRQAFRDGISLRTVVQRVIDSDHFARDVDGLSEEQLLSFALGYGDELLDGVRHLVLDRPVAGPSEARRDTE